MSTPFSSYRFSLRQKLTFFISLLVIVACCALSWYLIDRQARAMDSWLVRTGTIVGERLSTTSRFSVISRDHTRLNLLSEGTLTIPEIMYISFLEPTGSMIFNKQKSDSHFTPLAVAPPDHDSSGLPLSPQIRPYHRVQDHTEIIDRSVTTMERIYMALGGEHRESFIDVVYPISNVPMKQALTPRLFEDLDINADEHSDESTAHPVLGYVQLGISTETYEQELLSTIRLVLMITGIIIVVTLTMTSFLAKHLMKPLQTLAALANQVSEGNLDVTAPASTTDEISDLAQTFNHMVRSLQQRDESLAQQLDRLRTLNAVSTATTSSLDPTAVLDRILQLLVTNIGFKRSLLMLYDPAKQCTTGARIAGVSPEIAEVACALSIPIQADGTLPSDVILSGKHVLVPDLDEAKDRIDARLFELTRHMETTSLILIPLRSQQRILGFAGASRGTALCTQEDVDLLSTIGSQVGTAIDNAQTYKKLEATLESLEQRVHDRTTELRRANDRLKELNRLKSAVVTNVSHELRTPLASIKMHVDNVLDGNAGALQDQQKMSLYRVRKNSERLRRMINDMLDLSRIESGNTTIQPSVVALLPVLSEVIESLRPLITSRHLHVDARHHPTLPTLWVEEDKLYQILMNVLHNAAKFCSENGTIEITTTITDDELIQICVADNGDGIDPDELDRIFLPYYRSSNAAIRDRGAGLGLSISKSLIEMHGGSLWVKSTLHQGSQFFFTLPLARTRTASQGAPKSA